MSGYYTVYIARNFNLGPNETVLIKLGEYHKLENENWYLADRLTGECLFTDSINPDEDLTVFCCYKCFPTTCQAKANRQEVSIHNRSNSKMVSFYQGDIICDITTHKIDRICSELAFHDCGNETIRSPPYKFD